MNLQTKDYKGFIILGVDPGFHGGLSFLNPEDMSVKSYPMPIIKGEKTRLDTQTILDLFLEHSPEMMCIERVGAMPGQGVTSMFSFGYYAGYFEGLAAGLALPFVKFTPQAWMKDIFGSLGGEDGKTSISFCQKIWSSNNWLATPRSRVPHDGMTDSACIALAGYRKWRLDAKNTFLKS